MNTLAIVAFFAALAATNAGFIAPSTRIIQGPSTRTTIAGPDGSVIDSVAPGGTILPPGATEATEATEEHAGVVAHTAPVVSSYAAYGFHALPAHAAYSAPVSAYSSPVVSAYSAPVVSAYSSPWVSAHSSPLVSAYSSAPVVSAYAAPSVVASGVVAHKSVDTVVAGPSGTIATSKTVAAPTVYAAHGVHGLYLQVVSGRF